MATGRRLVTVELGQSCQATVIPCGQPMLLQRGGQVVVTQTLGGSVTVQIEMGYLVRINAEDSAALGLSALSAKRHLPTMGRSN